MIHSEVDSKIKCDALKQILSDVYGLAVVENQYDIAERASSGLDLLRELKGEFSPPEK